MIDKERIKRTETQYLAAPALPAFACPTSRVFFLNPKCRRGCPHRRRLLPPRPPLSCPLRRRAKLSFALLGFGVFGVQGLMIMSVLVLLASAAGAERSKQLSEKSPLRKKATPEGWRRRPDRQGPRGGPQPRGDGEVSQCRTVAHPK